MNSERINWKSNSSVRYRASLKHLVHIQGAILKDLEHIQDGFKIHNANFLLNKTEKSIDLVSSFMFTPNACRKNQFATINRFETRLMKWKESNFYPKKYRNVHKCEIHAFEFSRVDSKIIEIFGKLINADLNVSDYGKKLHNDLIIFLAPLNFNVDSKFAYGYPHEIDFLSFFIPPGELYTPFEKMMLPFEDEVWIGIAVTLLLGF